MTQLPSSPASWASARVSQFPETVFATYTELAKTHQAINLGQGFPDFDPPEFARQALQEAALGNQQYAPLSGLPLLLETLRDVLHAPLGRWLEPAELLVTVGVTEGLFASMQALLNPGDEVLLLEPFYDAYPADVLMAGGVPRYVPLDLQADGHWALDLDKLQAALSPKTKVLLLNNPHNPSGKVFSADELDALLALAHAHNFLILSDEVYEHICFEDFHPLASRPGAWGRCLSLSSIGKSFSVTGWKVGWLYGAADLVRAVRSAHQWIPFVVPTPLQYASAQLLRYAQHSDYYATLRQDYQHKRDLLSRGLEASPFKPLPSQGSYFLLADSSALGYPDDVSLCQALPEKAGVAAIPPSAFYSLEHKHLAKQLVRFAFCKRDEALQQAAERLAHLEVV